MTGGDSAGVPWAGRTLTPQPFAGDEGGADPALAAALAAMEEAGGTPEAVVAAFAAARVFVPILAVLGEGHDARPADGDKNADMALMTIEVADGRLLPCFTSVAALTAWNATARPVPVEAARAAQAAVLEECTRIALDPAGPVPHAVERPMFWAVAQGREWVRPAEDPRVREAVGAALAGVPGIVAHRCDPEPGHPAALLVTLGLPPGLPGPEVSGVTARAGERLAADPTVAERVTGVRLVLRAA